MKNTRIKSLLFSGLFLLASIQFIKADDADLAQANNPLANFKAFNIHDYAIGELTGPGDLTANQAWLRYAQPFTIGESSWLLRASLPMITNPVNVNNTHKSGIGDFNIFAAYMIDVGNPGISFGIGPQLTLDTATDDRLGSQKNSAGLADVLFNAESSIFQYGYLLTWQASFSGSDDRDDVNAGAFQPFAMYQLGGGTYLRSTGIMVYDFEHDTYTVPLGFGIGQVIPTDKVVYNVFIEPQYSIANKGNGWAEWQVFIGFNMQFK
jgi:hypothetical protein